MQKRAFERIHTNVPANFIYGDTIHTGTVTNISENGMYINTRTCFPFKSEFDVLIPFKKDVLNVPVKVSRLIKKGDNYDGMGLELLKQPQNYLEFLSSLGYKPVKSLKTEREETKIFVCKLCCHIAFDEAPIDCPICRTSIENFENNNEAIKRPEDLENLSEMGKKHIPVITASKELGLSPGGGINVHVKVGEIEHGMAMEDHITFIDFYLKDYLIKKRCLARVSFRCERIQPATTFHIKDMNSGTLLVVSNCSAHGSWLAEINI